MREYHSVQLATYDVDGQKGSLFRLRNPQCGKGRGRDGQPSMGNSVSFARSAGQQVVMDLTRGVMLGRHAVDRRTGSRGQGDTESRI